MESTYADEVVRQTAEKNINSLAQSLKHELSINDAQANPNRRVHTSILVVGDEDENRFIALDGSAHMMGPLFKELFERRPDLVGVVRETLGRMFRVVDR